MSQLGMTGIPTEVESESSSAWASFARGGGGSLAVEDQSLLSRSKPQRRAPGPVSEPCHQTWA